MSEELNPLEQMWLELDKANKTIKNFLRIAGFEKYREDVENGAITTVFRKGSMFFTITQEILFDEEEY